MSDPLIRTIFVEALDQPTAVERARFLDEACGADVALRQQVEVLLQAHEEAGSFFADASKRAMPTEPPSPLPTEKPGDKIGRYKLLQQIGEGGCGVVYMAEQEEPVRRRVALKVIKLGMDTKSVIARFEAERQALALMDHPNIAKIFDAGITGIPLTPALSPNGGEGVRRTGKGDGDAQLSPGRPYFVMELVRGIKITQFCNENKLATEGRLKLFIQVCQAIQHAHQKGVIHRDIKPSNILVTINDDVAVPKVIDFGIAKATAGRLTDHTLFTAFEQFIGTPAYMSPEQAVMTSLDIDTRSDIYSLGVLLYELLTGRTPFDQNELLAAGLDEMRRTIREKEPVKPSTRLTQELAAIEVHKQGKVGKWAGEKVGDGAPPVGESHSPTHPPAHFQPHPLQQRQELHSLISVLRGDLDWIVMKCLEKNRARRYDTANGLAADLQRHLNNEPVLARPPSKLYEFQKTVRRHKFGFAAATVLVLLLMVGVAGLALSNSRIRREQKLKEVALTSATRSDRESRAQLYTSLKSQAEVRRYRFHRIGQRFESLAAITNAAQIQRDAELRDAAIAVLAVPDLRLGPKWHAYSTNDLDITFSANYEEYARIDNQNVISICTVADQREVRRFSSGPPPQLHGNERSFRFSSDDRLLAKLEANDCWSVWRVENGQLVLRTPPANGIAFAFSRDATQIAIPVGDSIVLFDLNTGEERKRWRFQHVPYSLAFSPDNQLLAAGPAKAEVVSIYEVEGARLRSELLAGPGTERVVVAWHPSGDYLAVGACDGIQFWDVKAGAKMDTLTGHAQLVTTLSFHPSGDWLISDNWDGTPRLWQPSPGREWLQFFSGANLLRFSPNGRWAGVVLPGDGEAQLLELVPSQIYHTFVASLHDSLNSFHFGTISGDGRLLALTATDVVIRELASGREVALLPAGDTSTVQFHPNGKELLVSSRQGLSVWPIVPDAAASNRVSFGPPRRLLTFEILEFAVAADGRTMAVSSPATEEARIVDLYTGALRPQRFRHAAIQNVALSPDARWLATSGWHSTQVQLWDAQTGERLLTLTGERARAAFTPDGKEMVVAMSQAFVFYDVKTQKVTHRIQREGSMHLGYLAFSHDGRLMALEVVPGVIRLCDVATKRTIANLQEPNGNVGRWIGFTPDDTQLIVAAQYERAIHRWDLRAMRVELKAMGLDWDWPEFPPRSRQTENASALQVDVLTSQTR